MQKRQNHVRLLRVFRKIHKISGLSLMFFLLLTGITGILLGWKKNSAGIILADTMQGSSTSMESWLPIHTLIEKVLLYTKDSLHFDPKFDRIEVRPEKGVVKFTFKNSFLGIQMDSANGNVLLVEKRYSDLIEQIHDGSIIDKALGWKSGVFKLIYTTTLGMGLIIFCLTGFWLWYGPKVLKKVVGSGGKNDD